jgi:hypothetical protein
MKKVVLIVLGVLGILAGLAMLVGGTAIAAVFGTDGRYESSRERLDTATNAIVSEPVDIEDDAPFEGDFGDVTIRLQAEAAQGGEVFLGVGRAADVDEYLRDVAVEVVDDWGFDNESVEKRELPGTRQPDAPTEQTFWETVATGTGEQTIDWELRSGSYTLVVMNADGSEGVDVTARWGIEIPWLFPLGVVLLVVGAVSLLVGILLLVLGIRARGRPATPAPPTVWQTPPPPGTSPPGSAPTPSSAWTPPPPPGS